MARFIDDMRRALVLQAPDWVPRDRESQDKLRDHTKMVMGYVTHRDLPVLVIDNVAEYYYAGTSQENWNIVRDFPSLAPPFPVFWAEHRLPKLIRSEQFGDQDMASRVPHGRSGWLVMYARGEDVLGQELPIEAAWYLCAEHFIDFGNGFIQGPHGTFLMAIDEKGVLVGNPWAQVNAEKRFTELILSHLSWLHPVLLAISFLHCKNVIVEDNHPDPKLRKRYAERHNGATLTSYKTLVIEPLKQILKHEGGSDKNGIAHAMHICRGHFKDYRQGAGLFGKYHKLVWQPSLIRGTKGEVAPPRTLKVNPPKVKA